MRLSPSNGGSYAPSAAAWCHPRSRLRWQPSSGSRRSACWRRPVLSPRRQRTTGRSYVDLLKPPATNPCSIQCSVQQTRFDPFRQKYAISSRRPAGLRLTVTSEYPQLHRVHCLQFFQTLSAQTVDNRTLLTQQAVWRQKGSASHPNCLDVLNKGRLPRV